MKSIFKNIQKKPQTHKTILNKQLVNVFRLIFVLGKNKNKMKLTTEFNMQYICTLQIHIQQQLLPTTWVVHGIKSWFVGKNWK